MKTFSIPVLSFALLSAAPLLADTPAASPPAATATGKESIPSVDSLVNQSFSLLINIQQTLAAAQDKESADKAAKTLEGIQKDIKHFQDIMNKLNDAEQVGKDGRTWKKAGRKLQTGRQAPGES